LLIFILALLSNPKKKKKEKKWSFCLCFAALVR
jgi:hypothetical protein